MLLKKKIEVKIKDFTEGSSWKEIFESKGPLKVEICSGKDEFLIRMAEREPQTCFVGIERSLSVSAKLISKIDRSGLANIRVVCEPAELVLKECFGSNQIEMIYINFPDPWPKRKHYKRRLINSDFIPLVIDRLNLGGVVQFVSDHKDYVQWALAHFEANPALKNLFGKNNYKNNVTDYPPTLFMKKYIREGREFYFLNFIKQSIDKKTGI